MLVLFAAAVGAETAAERVAHFPLDSAAGWGPCHLAEDKPLSVSAVTAADMVHQGEGAVALRFDPQAGPVGMKYLQVRGLAGSDGLAFWVLGDGSGADMQIRLSQADWSAWDSPMYSIDFTGWRRIVIPRRECSFHNWGGNGRKWDDIRIFAPRISGAKTTVVLDDLGFYRNTGELARAVVVREPLQLTFDASAGLPPIPAMLKGVDFALVNWGAKKEHHNFGPETQRQFRRSNAKLVRFWTYCPPLEVSPGPGEYNWERFDTQMKRIQDAGAEVIMTCCFTPAWLSVDGTKEGLPSDWEAYERLIADTVRHCKEKDWPVRYWEAWNEPDLSDSFLKGGIEDFNRLYGHFTRAVRSADRNARVGGGAFSKPDTEWIGGFLDHVRDGKLPLDFVSWHGYALSPAAWASTTKLVDDMAAERGFEDVEMLATEWNVAGGGDDAYDSEYVAAGQIAVLDHMLRAGLDGSVYFAFKESNWRFPDREFGGSWGMVTTHNVPKASFHSFRMLAEMTGRRLAVRGAEGTCGAIACEAGSGTDILLWRFDPLAEGKREVRVALEGLAGGPLTVKADLVDREHSNAYRDREQTDLQQVGLWEFPDAAALGRHAFELRPLSVMRLRVRR
jgi:lambda repressor-like predicted transcriptional regulator